MVESEGLSKSCFTSSLESYSRKDDSFKLKSAKLKFEESSVISASDSLTLEIK